VDAVLSADMAGAPRANRKHNKAQSAMRSI
jgi:hypothetical protein